MDSSNRLPGAWLGALIGGLLMFPVIALMYLAEQLANLPFLPFVLFNFMARVLPGPIITFGIDTMVDVLTLIGLGGDNLDEAAKTAERLMGLGIFWGLGLVSATILFFVLNRVTDKAGNLGAGAIMGLTFGLPFVLIAQFVDGLTFAAAPPVLWYLWFGILFLGFGGLTAWAYDTLRFETQNITLSEEKPKAGAEPIDRRSFIVRVGGASAVLTVVGSGLGAVLSQQLSGGSADNSSSATTNIDPDALPNASASVQPAPGTRPEYTPVEDHYRIDILAGGTPNIPDDYRLMIGGMVANPQALSLEDIRAMPSQDAFVTMGCISNRIGGSLISTTKWTGVSMQELVEMVEPDEGAGALKITGFDNFDEFVSLDMIRNDDRIMLTYDWDDAPLPDRNGFPLRIHIPNRYGMKQPKWIREIEFVESEERGYWVRRGWSAEAIVRTTSVIDTVATEAIYRDADGNYFVPIGGIAWAGDRGIARVEVRVNDGEWREAQLREPLSERTWVIWRYDYPFEAGSHTFEVRAYEKPGEGQDDPVLQITEDNPTRPDGATGIHSDSEFLRESMIPQEAEA